LSGAAANEGSLYDEYRNCLKTLLIVLFAVGVLPFAAGVIYCGLNFRPCREFPPRNGPVIVMVIGFLLAAAAGLTGIVRSESNFR
jgi:hypothetical protein